ITMTLPSTFMAISLHRLGTELLGDRRDLLALLLGRLRELGRPANVEELAGGGKALANQRIGGNDLANTRVDALAQLFWHLGRPEQTDQAVECEAGVAGLLDPWDRGRR